MFSFTSLSAFMLCALSLLLGAARFAAVGRVVPADEAPG